VKGPRLIVRALLVEEGKLLVNRHKDRLALFGGRVEKGETLQGALFRELEEELGVPVEVGPLVYLIENFYRDRRRIHEVGFYFRVRPLRPIGAVPRPRESWLRPAWLPLAEVGGSALRPRLLRQQLTAGISDKLVQLCEVDQQEFPEVQA
jgi:ADP-ribose pyrophosphatase YjhB (NUDIX family)